MTEQFYKTETDRFVQVQVSIRVLITGFRTARVTNFSPDRGPIPFPMMIRHDPGSSSSSSAINEFGSSATHELGRGVVTIV